MHVSMLLLVQFQIFVCKQFVQHLRKMYHVNSHLLDYNFCGILTVLVLFNFRLTA